MLVGLSDARASTEKSMSGTVRMRSARYDCRIAGHESKGSEQQIVAGSRLRKTKVQPQQFVLVRSVSMAGTARNGEA
jgi:hypothetical protein